jgi:UDP-3-O-[3-hydroxymyristoyl] glucosamine N-acyltransferase
MAVTLADLAQLVSGTLIGHGEVQIEGAATLSTSGRNEITFVDSADRLPRLDQSRAAAVVAPRSLAIRNRPTIQVDDVHASFAKIVCLFRPVRPQPRIGISSAAAVSPSARLAHDVDCTLAPPLETTSRSARAAPFTRACASWPAARSANR